MLDRWILVAPRGDDAGGHRGPRRLRAARRRRRRSPRSSTTCPTGTCAGHAGGSGAPIPTRRARTPSPPTRPCSRSSPRWRCPARAALPVPRRPPLPRPRARRDADASVHLADWPRPTPRRRRRGARGADGRRPRARLPRPGGARRGRGQGPPAARGARSSSCRSVASRPPTGIVEDELNVDRLEYCDGALRRAHLRARARTSGPSARGSASAVKELPRGAAPASTRSRLARAARGGRRRSSCRSSSDVVELTRRRRSSCGCAPRAASRSRATAPRWSRSTSSSPTTCAGAGCCATSSDRSRTCARARASTSPTAIELYLDRLRRPATGSTTLAREVLADEVVIGSGRGRGRGRWSSTTSATRAPGSRGARRARSAWRAARRGRALARR